MTIKNAVLLLVLFLTGVPAVCFAREVALIPLPFGNDGFNSSLTYSRFDQEDDFDGRGVVRTIGNAVTSELGYAFRERSIVSLQGALLSGVEQTAQQSQWYSRAGHLFGIAFRHQVFPVTEYRPGVQLSAGVSRFTLPFDRVDTGGTVTSIDHQVSGWSYSGRVTAHTQIWRMNPYAGLQGSGRDIRWRDHQPSATSAAEVSGSAEGNISIVVGLPIRIRKDARLQFEGLFLNQTSLTAGITIALF